MNPVNFHRSLVGIISLGFQQCGSVFCGLGFSIFVGSRQSRFDSLGDKFFCFVHECRDHLIFGDDSNDLSLDEKVTFLSASRDPKVSMLCFPGSIHDAPHHRDLNRECTIFKRRLRLICNGNHIDFGSSATWARNKIKPFSLPQPERL
jgi:hypothetical protein